MSTDTKYGRWASMGGLQFTTASHSRQVAMMEEATMTAKTVSGAAKTLGWVGGGLTVGSDIWGNINYYKYGDMSPYAVSPLQTMTDLGASYIGIYGGLPGVIISTVYFSLSPYMYAPMGISPITVSQTSDATYVAPQYQH